MLARVIGEEQSCARTDHQYTKHLGNKPPVALNATPVLHQFALRTLDVVNNIFCVCVNPLDLLALLGDHLRKLTEDATKFLDRGFD